MLKMEIELTKKKKEDKKNRIYLLQISLPQSIFEKKNLVSIFVQVFNTIQALSRINEFNYFEIVVITLNGKFTNAKFYNFRRLFRIISDSSLTLWILRFNEIRVPLPAVENFIYAII